MKAIKLSLKKKKYQYACKQYRNRFVENEPSEEEKNRKRQCAREQYRNLSKQKKNTKSVNMLA